METIDIGAITVRKFNRKDIRQLRQLMYDLAVFEGYADQFAVTEEHIETFGLTDNPQFHCFVAHSLNSHQLLGMAVVHVIDWTFDLKPTLVLKELFVKECARGGNVGLLMMKAVANHAKQCNASRVKWLVLKNNQIAKKFYQGLGATEDDAWENWGLDESAIDQLVE